MTYESEFEAVSSDIAVLNKQDSASGEVALWVSVLATALREYDLEFLHSKLCLTLCKALGLDHFNLMEEFNWILRKIGKGYSPMVKKKKSGPARRFNEDVYKTAVAMHLSGCTYRSIAKTLGVSNTHAKHIVTHNCGEIT